MLTPRENFIATVSGGSPDRLVKQFEFMDTNAMFSDPFGATNGIPFFPGDEDKTDYWGVTWTYPAYTIGAFPYGDAAHIRLKDITQWESVLTAPPVSDYPDEVWEAARTAYDAVDRTQYFAGPMVSPGVFETMHSLMGMEGALCSFLEEPEATHELIDFIVDWECSYVKEISANLHPDIVLHHDDWGSKDATFLSVPTFDEFLLPAYKKLYACYKECGFKYIVHHCDSYAESLVPEMIEIGIDVWQGGVGTNDLAGVLKTYGGQISIMSGLETADLDVEGWTAESIQAAVDTAAEKYAGYGHWIPCLTQGGPLSTFEGVYDAASNAIGIASNRLFA